MSTKPIDNYIIFVLDWYIQSFSLDWNWRKGTWQPKNENDRFVADLWWTLDDSSVYWRSFKNGAYLWWGVEMIDFVWKKKNQCWKVFKF